MPKIPSMRVIDLAGLAPDPTQSSASAGREAPRGDGQRGRRPPDGRRRRRSLSSCPTLTGTARAVERRVVGHWCEEGFSYSSGCQPPLPHGRRAPSIEGCLTGCLLTSVVDEEDIAAVVEVRRADFLTTGPRSRDSRKPWRIHRGRARGRRYPGPLLSMRVCRPRCRTWRRGRRSPADVCRDRQCSALRRRRPVSRTSIR